MTRHFCL